MANGVKVADNKMVVWMVEPEQLLTKRQIDNKAKRYLELKALRKEAEERVAELKAEMDGIKEILIAQTGNAVGKNEIDTDRFHICNTASFRKGFDTARLRAERADIVAEYGTESPYNTVTVKAKG